MNSPPEQKSFIQIISPQEESKDMTRNSVDRQFNVPVRNYFYFIIASLILCLLATLGTIAVFIIQLTGFVAQCDRSQRPEMDELPIQSTSSMMSEKAMAYLQVLKPINDLQLKWNTDGLLYNIQYDQGSLVIQTSGSYFIYCHLQLYIPQCGDDVIDFKLSLLVDEHIIKQTVNTVCSSPTEKGINHDIFTILLVELDAGAKISAQIKPFAYLDADNLPSSNVLGAFRYTGEEWRCQFVGTIAGKCI